MIWSSNLEEVRNCRSNASSHLRIRPREEHGLLSASFGQLGDNAKGNNWQARFTFFLLFLAVIRRGEMAYFYDYRATRSTTIAIYLSPYRTCYPRCYLSLFIETKEYLRSLFVYIITRLESEKHDDDDNAIIAAFFQQTQLKPDRLTLVGEIHVWQLEKSFSSLLFVKWKRAPGLLVDNVLL